jgi:23S rRNA (uracil1939-C5)-methyltransferase
LSLGTLHDITIDSLGGLGDGLARLNDKPVFIEKAAPGDRLKIRIIHETKEALRGEIVEIISGGLERITPPCPYYSACGGCSLQHVSSDFYQQSQKRVLAQALAHGGFADIEAELIFLPAASRRRVEFKVTRTENGLSFAYYASRSRTLVPVANCLILEPALQALMAPLANALGKWPGTRFIKTVSLTAADSGIDMLLDCAAPIEDMSLLSALADGLKLARISISVAGQKTVTALSRTPVTMRLGDYDVALPPDAFLQASSEGQRLLTEAVMEGVEGAKSVADLFCGIGTYSFCLSKIAHVHAVEMDADMVRGLKSMITLHGLPQRMSAEQRDLFKTPMTAKDLTRFNAVIINPPRPGAKTQVEEIAKSQIKKLVMVSCSPASFARDAKALKTAGFTIERAFGVDQFVYSPHLEIVAVFKK